MTILNNFKKLVYLCFGYPQYSYLSGTPSSSTDPNNYLTFEDATSFYVKRGSTSSSNNKVTIVSHIERIFAYSTAGSGTSLSNSMAPSNFEFITEDFNIVDNNYPANLTGGDPATDYADTVTMGSSFHNFKQVYNMTLNNTTAEATTIYGIQINALINSYYYTKSTQKWYTSDNSYAIPIWVVKFDQPKVLQSGESLTVSYSVDFNNLIDEVNDVTVVQQ